MSDQNTFSTWTPIELIKGSDGKVKKMRIGGLASTGSKDADGEFIDPNGLDVSYFLKSGYLNWNHQSTKDPEAIIGRPTKAQKTKRGLEIEGELFQSAKAKQVYELAKLLEQEGLALGLSIEGKALQRGSTDKDSPEYKKVLKAMVTGCAVTPNPKNADTVATLIKGHSFDQLSAYEDEDEEETEKAMSAGSASGRAISKESLNDDLKVTTFQDKEVEKQAKKLTKADVYKKLFDRYPNIDGASAERIFKLTHKIDKSIVMKQQEEANIEVSEEAFEKSLEVINDITKGEESTEITDSSKEEAEDTTSQEEASEQVDESTEEEDDLEKAVTPEHEEAAKMILEAQGYTVSKDDLEKGQGDELNEEQEEGGEENNTSDDEISELIKGLGDDIKKGIKADFEKSLKVIPELGTLVKGLVERYRSLEDQVEAIGRSSQGSKSVTATTPLEKSMERDIDLEKGHGKEEAVPTLSVSRNKRQVLDELEKSYWSDENGGQVLNKALANDALTFESSNQVSPAIKEFFNKKGVKLVA